MRMPRSSVAVLGLVSLIACRSEKLATQEVTQSETELKGRDSRCASTVRTWKSLPLNPDWSTSDSIETGEMTLAGDESVKIEVVRCVLHDGRALVMLRIKNTGSEPLYYKGSYDGGADLMYSTVEDGRWHRSLGLTILSLSILWRGYLVLAPDRAVVADKLVDADKGPVRFALHCADHDHAGNARCHGGFRELWSDPIDIQAAASATAADPDAWKRDW